MGQRRIHKGKWRRAEVNEQKITKLWDTMNPGIKSKFKSFVVRIRKEQRFQIDDLSTLRNQKEQIKHQVHKRKE